MKKHALLLGTIILISAGLYAKTLWAGLIFDDYYQILNNKWLTGLKYLPEILTSPHWAFHEGDFSGGASNYYRPITHLIYLIGYQFFGPNPYGYHLINIIFHSMNSILVFLVASILFGTAGIDVKNSSRLLFATLAALIFAAHPINVEPISWISSIPELSLAFFFLLSFYLYLLYRKRAEETVSTNRSVLIPYTLSIIMYAMALISKETAIVLPLLFAVYDFPFKKPLNLIRRYLPYCAVAIIYLYIRSRIVGSEDSIHASSSYQYIWTIFYLTGQYFEKLLLPVYLKTYYFFQPADSIADLSALEALSVITFTVLLALSIYIGWSRKKLLPIGLMLIVIPLLPPILSFNYIHGERLVSERYLYIPSAGFALLLSYGFMYLYEHPIHRSFSNISRRAILVFILAFSLLASYSAMTVKRTAIWKDEYAYWSEAVKWAPQSAVTHANLGTAYTDKKMYKEGLREYEAALKIKTDWDGLYMNIGSLYYNLNIQDNALEMFNKALSVSTNDSIKGEIYSRLGRIYFKKSDWDKSILNYEKALALNYRKDADLYNKLGIAYGNKGLLKEAIKAFQIVLTINPGHSGARKNIEKVRKILNGGD
jgi:tetratricopeptide (TPR) repeat protein